MGNTPPITRTEGPWYTVDVHLGERAEGNTAADMSFDHFDDQIDKITIMEGDNGHDYLIASFNRGEDVSGDVLYQNIWLDLGARANAHSFAELAIDLNGDGIADTAKTDINVNGKGQHTYLLNFQKNAMGKWQLVFDFNANTNAENAHSDLKTSFEDGIDLINSIDPTYDLETSPRNLSTTTTDGALFASGKAGRTVEHTTYSAFISTDPYNEFNGMEFKFTHDRSYKNIMGIMSWDVAQTSRWEAVLDMPPRGSGAITKEDP